MIFKESFLSIIDNSGAKRAQCINVLGQLKIAYPGSVLISTIKKAIPKHFKKKKKIIKRGEIHKLLLCFTKRNLMRLTGHYLKGPFNGAIVLRKENMTLPFANRIKHGVFFNVRRISTKLLSMAPNVY